MLSGSGEALESTERRWGSTAAGGEEGDGDGSTGRSGLRGSAESFRARRRSSCACRRDEGGDGGCGNGEWRRRQRSGAVRESKGEGEGKSEEADRVGTAPATSPSASRWQGRGQAGWWRGGTAVRTRRPHACPSGARTTMTGTGPVSWAGTEPGQQVAQVSPGKGFPPFCLFSIFLTFVLI